MIIQQIRQNDSLYFEGKELCDNLCHELNMKEDFKVRSVKYNFFMNIILKLSSFIFPLITFPYVSRVLLAEANGKLSFASAVVSYFSLFASLGIPTYGVRKCAEVRDKREILSKTVKELLIINSLCAIVTYGALFITVLCVPKMRNDMLLYWISSLSIVFNVIGVEWFYQAIEQYQYITVRNIFFKIIAIILMFISVHKPEDYLIYAGINIIGTVGSNVLNFIRLKKYIDLSPFIKQKYNFKVHLVPIITLFLYSATTTIYTNLDQVMLGFMVGDESVGFYSAAIKIKNILVSVITALGAVMLPRVSYCLKNGKMDEFSILIKKSFQFICIVSIPISIFFFLRANDVINLLAGNQYRESITILKYLMPAIVFIGLSSVTAWQLLIPLGKEKCTVYGAIIGASIDLIINFVLIPKMGAAGAAIGTTVAEFVVLFSHMVILKDIIKKLFKLKTVCITLLSGISAAIICVGFNKVIIIDKIILRCVCDGVIYFGGYLVMLILFKEAMIKEILEKWLRKYKSLIHNKNNN